MTIDYTTTRAKLAAAHTAVDDLSTYVGATPELQPLTTPVLTAGQALLQADAALNALTLKPLPRGLWSRDNPVASRLYDAAYGGFIGRVNWKDLEPSQGQFVSAPIDAIRATAKARGKVAAIRFYSGDQAPDWAKAIGTGPIKVYNPTDMVWGSVGPWWNTTYQSAYEAALAYIASQVEDDPLFLMVSMSLGGMIYPEPFLRSIGNAATWTNLKNAGLTTAKDHAAIQFGVQAHERHFTRTRTFVTIHPGQNFDLRRSDPAWSDSMVQYTRDVLDQRGIFYSTSLDAKADKTADYQHLYNQFALVDGPRAIQTEQNSRISDWAAMMAYGEQLGFSMVETSPGGWETRQSVAQASAYSDALAANTASYPA